MQKDEVDPWLLTIGKDRKWLADACGYSYDYVRNSLAPKAQELPEKFAAALDRVKEQTARASRGGIPAGSVWDSVYFSGAEVARIDQARRVGGYQTLPALYRDAVIDFADRLLEAEEDTPRLRIAEDEREFRVNKQSGK